ncbi:MAG: hypothetical protein IKT57_00410 [Clostridia bacterium]|nr:hypothetical protein [Clostridia bacterium]
MLSCFPECGDVKHRCQRVEGKSATGWPVQDLFEAMLQFCARAIARQRLNALTKADADHARDRGDIGSDAASWPIMALPA